MSRALTRRALGVLVVSAAAAPARAQPGRRKPPLPPGRDPGPSAIPFAIIDSGVDYRQASIAARLARDGEGGIIGWDGEDNDNLPLDRPFASGGGPALGTALASQVLADAGASRLVPVRRRPGDPLSLARSLSFIAQTPARIALIVHTSADEAEWRPFREACTHYRDLLVVASAGEGGRDLDDGSLFPAALRLDNLMVVAPCDGNGCLMRGANLGRASVDVAVPAVSSMLIPPPLPAEPQILRRSDAAAATVAALAVRLKAVAPELVGAAMKTRILSLARPAADGPATRAGWIPNARRAFWLE